MTQTDTEKSKAGEGNDEDAPAAMPFILQPWMLLWVAVAGWMNRQQQEAIDYLRAENKVLREKLGGGRIMLSDDQRRRLAVPGKTLGRKRLLEIGSLFSPDTILAWHRKLIAAKHAQKRKTTGRPSLDQQVVELVVRMAKENPTWGYDRIAGELKKLGHKISDTTVENILKLYGIPPRILTDQHGFGHDRSRLRCNWV